LGATTARAEAAEVFLEEEDENDDDDIVYD
jgi:hypothetical protein